MARIAFLVSILVCILVATPYVAAISCGTVASNLNSCINYAKGNGPLPPSCCNGIRNLHSAVKTIVDRQTACTCMKALASGNAGLKPDLVAGLPNKCGVSVPYPISASTDCSKVQ